MHRLLPNPPGDRQEAVARHVAKIEVVFDETFQIQV
jgi:hypothetical protein